MTRGAQVNFKITCVFLCFLVTAEKNSKKQKKINDRYTEKRYNVYIRKMWERNSLMQIGETLIVKIIDGDFDFSDFFDACDKYGRSRRLAVKQINMIQLMIEEVVVNHLLKHARNLAFEISCPKDTTDVRIELRYDGERYNLYTAEPGESLSIVIIKCLTKRAVYKYKEGNSLDIDMQLGVGEEAVIIEE